MKSLLLSMIFLTGAFAFAMEEQTIDTGEQPFTLDVGQTPIALWNVDPEGFLFAGFDVTTVFPDPEFPMNAQAKPVDESETGGYIPEPLEGDRNIFVQMGEVKLAFASEENRQRFLDTPDELKSLFLPKFGGWCAKAMASGYLVPIDPTASMVVPDSNGRLTFFTQALDLARVAYMQNLDTNYGMSEIHWANIVKITSIDESQPVADFGQVGIGGNARAASNGILAFLSQTPPIETLKLLPAPLAEIRMVLQGDAEL